MNSLEYGSSLRKVDALIAEWHAVSADQQAAKQQMIDVCNDAIGYEKNLEVFVGVDNELSSMVDKCPGYKSFDKEKIYKILRSLPELSASIAYIENLVMECSAFTVDPEGYNIEQLCNDAKNLTGYCRSTMKSHDIAEAKKDVAKVQTTLEGLLSYLKSERATLDANIRDLKKTIDRMSGFANRYGCHDAIKKAQNLLNKIPSGNDSADIKKVKKEKTALDGVAAEFRKEEETARMIYHEICSDRIGIWSDLRTDFEARMRFVIEDSLAKRKGFDLDDMIQDANALKVRKSSDISDYESQYPKKAETYRESLYSEVVNADCSYQFFLNWQENVNEDIRRRRKEKWIKFFKILWSVLKVLFYIAGCVFIACWFIFKFFFNIATNSRDDDDDD